MATKRQNLPKTAVTADIADEDPFSAQGKLQYLRGPAGERDRVTLWKLGRGTLPGTADGGLLEGWLENGR